MVSKKALSSNTNLPPLDLLYNQKDMSAFSFTVYFDFQKDFDLVLCDILLQKLANFDFVQIFLALFNSYS